MQEGNCGDIEKVFQEISYFHKNIIQKAPIIVTIMNNWCFLYYIFNVGIQRR